jgi:hypothetical protein
MKVKDLVAKLSKLPQNADVEMSSDSEGNQIRPLYGVEHLHESKVVTLWPGF